MSDAVDPVESLPLRVYNLQRELAEAKEQRDRLAEALKGMLNVTYGQVIYNFMEPQRSAAREALAAAKGGKDE
jgi:hypothetical protein